MTANICPTCGRRIPKLTSNSDKTGVPYIAVYKRLYQLFVDHAEQLVTFKMIEEAIPELWPRSYLNVVIYGLRKRYKADIKSVRFKGYILHQ